MNPLAPAHYREEMERSHRRMNLLVRIAELRRIIPAAEREGKHDLAEACKSDIALHEERNSMRCVGKPRTSSHFFDYFP